MLAHDVTLITHALQCRQADADPDPLFPARISLPVSGRCLHYPALWAGLDRLRPGSWLSVLRDYPSRGETGLQPKVYLATASSVRHSAVSGGRRNAGRS